jgi:polyketide cyclase/dehydrase/lipid transport protein
LLTLQAATQVASEPKVVWDVLVDWPGQSRWIPFTTVDVLSDHDQGLGVRAVALSGWWLGRIPLGLLDNFVVTGWTAPSDGTMAELEVLHFGPYFTGEGVFQLKPADGGTAVRCTEVFRVPGGKPLEVMIRAGLPIMRRALEHSLRGLAAIADGRK